MNFKKNYKGMLLCLIIAIPCWFLGKKFPIVGGPYLVRIWNEPICCITNR